MQIITQVNQIRCLEWNINGTQGALFGLLSHVATWAKTIIIEEQVWYWCSKNKVITELPLYYKKADTVYRHLLLLEEKGLIGYTKRGQMDLIYITEKGKEWNKKVVDNDSDINSSDENKSPKTRGKIRMTSDINPNDLGNKSDILDNYSLEVEDKKLNPTSGCVSHEIAFEIIEKLPDEKETVTAEELKNLFGISPKVVTAWIKVRKTKRAPLTPLAFKQFVTQSKIANLSIEDAVNVCCDGRNWASFKAEWLTSSQYGTPQSFTQGNAYGDNL